MTDEYNSRNAEKFVVRLPDGVRDRIQDLAKEEHRSMNAWVVKSILEALKKSEATIIQSEDNSSVVFEGHIPWTPIRGMYVIYRGEIHELLELDQVPGGAIKAALKGVEELIDLRKLRPVLIKT